MYESGDTLGYRAPVPASQDMGRTLFRFRSLTPVPVVFLLAWLLWRSRGGDAAQGGFAPWMLGPLVALAGQALRFYVLGLVPEGTSGQGSVIEASTLNTRGPYAFVRNPLYLGNLFIVLGLLVVAHDPWVALVALAFFFGEYFFIIRAEEAYLRSRFREQFDAWCQQVRRWVPRLTPAAQGTLRAGGFDWKRALKKEHNPLMAWGTGTLALMGWNAWSSQALTNGLATTLLVLEICLTVFFIAVKGWKHRWLRRSPA
jgi:protein-S-isoprenylcysteine O-methyltransferase Ste14